MANRCVAMHAGPGKMAEKMQLLLGSLATFHSWTAPTIIHGCTMGSNHTFWETTEPETANRCVAVHAGSGYKAKSCNSC